MVKDLLLLPTEGVLLAPWIEASISVLKNECFQITTPHVWVVTVLQTHAFIPHQALQHSGFKAPPLLGMESESDTGGSFPPLNNATKRAEQIAFLCIPWAYTSLNWEPSHECVQV